MVHILFGGRGRLEFKIGEEFWLDERSCVNRCCGSNREFALRLDRTTRIRSASGIHALIIRSRVQDLQCQRLGHDVVRSDEPIAFVQWFAIFEPGELEQHDRSLRTNSPEQWLTVAMGDPASIVVVNTTGICSSRSQSAKGTMMRGGRFGSTTWSSGRVPVGIGFRLLNFSGEMNGCASTPGMISKGRGPLPSGFSKLRNLSVGTNGRSSTPGLSGITLSEQTVASSPAGFVAITRYSPAS